MTLRLLLTMVLVAVIPAGCSPYAKVVERTPVVAVGTPPPTIGSAGSPLESAGLYLAAVQTAAQRLQTAPRDNTALAEYNFALSRFLGSLRAGHVDAWSRPLLVPGPQGGFVITTRPTPGHPDRHPSQHDLIPSDQLQISGSYMTARTVKPGLGAPVVAVRREARANARQRFAVPRSYYGLTAVARFKGRNCEVAFEDPLAGENVQMGGHTYPLGADFSAPIALVLSDTNPRKLEILNLLRPGDPKESGKLVRLQPFDPNKTTVLLVHGLADSPATWAPMLNTLRGDPEIRKHYQFWIFGYPSGYPYQLSAGLMRRELDGALKLFPQRKPMILIGHSMGGLICRLMITDPGDELWRVYFGDKRPERTSLSPEARDLMADSLLFRPRHEAGRVLFLATPHRGSTMATGWIGKLGARLIRAPQSLLKLGVGTLKLMVSDSASRAKARMPTSVDTLSPNNSFVKAINKIPICRGVPYHSVIGDRGRGDTPNSSDGIVPYWSSHLDGAITEKIVPSNHSVQQNPEAITEVLRILKEHRRRLN